MGSFTGVTLNEGLDSLLALLPEGIRKTTAFPSTFYYNLGDLPITKPIFRQYSTICMCVGVCSMMRESPIVASDCPGLS